MKSPAPHGSKAASPMRVLVYDPRVIGHHLEYLDHLARYAVDEGEIELHFVVHPHFERHAPSITRLANDHPSCVAIHPLSEAEFAATETDTVVQRAVAGWKALEKRARHVGASHCIFLEMNAYQPVLGLPRARTAPFQVSGILFFPYCRIQPRGTGVFDRLRASIERLRKYWQVRWVLSNSNVHTIFLLNDKLGAARLNDDVGRDIFRPLPDPVPLSPETPATEDEKEWSDTWWADNRLHFLLFGSLRRNKGVEQTVEAFSQLPAQSASQMALHLLGESRAELADELPRLTDFLKDHQPSLTVHVENRFLSDIELELALQRSHVVLAPYQRTEGSSGVIGHAAKHQCPVIGPHTGLIGSLIDEYDLGLMADTTKPDALCRALQQCLYRADEISNTKGMRRYVGERSPKTFAETIVSSLPKSTAQDE